jgi:hypothetical protein
MFTQMFTANNTKLNKGCYGERLVIQAQRDFKVADIGEYGRTSDWLETILKNYVPIKICKRKRK